MTATTEPTIRNQRYQPWPAAAINVGQIVPIAAGWILYFESARPVWQLVYGFAALLVIGVSTLQLHRLPLMHPVKLIKLGRKLTVLPKAYWLAPHAIKRIEFAPDPAEDYVELPVPVRLCEVTVTVHRWHRFRLIIGLDDAARLREWAVERGIPVNDQEGVLDPRASA
jgi:hypothetical protein